MYWLGYLTDGRQAGELDWKAIGGTWGCATSLVAKWEANPKVAVPWESFETCIKGIKKHSDLLGRYVHKYFEDVVVHVQSSRGCSLAGREFTTLSGTQSSTM
jgi:hypothetical protein